MPASVLYCKRVPATLTKSFICYLSLGGGEGGGRGLVVAYSLNKIEAKLLTIGRRGEEEWRGGEEGEVYK